MDEASFNKETYMVPYSVHETALARLERAHEKEMERVKVSKTRLWVTIILLIVCLVGMFIYEASHIEEVTESVVTNTDGGGDAYGTLVTGDNSEVYYGESDNNANQAENPQG